MNNTAIIFWALVGGILPALIWLFFWLREDYKRPEPTGLILRTFLLGMLSVILVLPLQKAVDWVFPGFGLLAIILWAILEEGFKFSAAYIGGLRSKEDNEPLDPIIYMITAALGFVALENTLFIANPLLQQDITGGVITGGLRFIGASLLHIVSSSAVGVALALGFYKPRPLRIIYGTWGIILATVFHSIFNLFIISQGGLGTFLTFGTVWAGVALLLLFFEKVKMIKPFPISTVNPSPKNESRDTMST